MLSVYEILIIRPNGHENNAILLITNVNYYQYWSWFCLYMKILSTC